MKNYLMLFRGGDSNIAKMSPEDRQAHMTKWMTWMGALSESGTMVGAEPLHATGKTIKGTKKVVSDGPFMEGKKLVGGYLICKAVDYDSAVLIGKGCPILEFYEATVELREVAEM
ncbi:MAG: hypothetical protein ACI9IP_001229 [Arcticibacterium sp.]|jgi:hypothetical protein